MLLNFCLPRHQEGGQDDITRITISNEITYNIFKGGKVGAANEMREECDHNCNKLDTLLVPYKQTPTEFIIWARKQDSTAPSTRYKCTLLETLYIPIPPLAACNGHKYSLSQIRRPTSFNLLCTTMIETEQANELVLGRRHV